MRAEGHKMLNKSTGSRVNDSKLLSLINGEFINELANIANGENKVNNGVMELIYLATWSMRIQINKSNFNKRNIKEK